MRVGPALAAAMALLIGGCRTGEPDPLIGVWLITQTEVTGPGGTSVNADPQPGVYFITEEHLSNMLIPGNAVRPLFSTERTDEERLRAYDDFIADAGPYVRTDSTLTVNNIIAKVPNAMPPGSLGAGLTYRYQVAGDSLVLTLRGGWAPPDGEITYTLRRLE